MRILVFTDLHVTPTSEMSQPLPDGTTTLLKEALDTMKWVAEQVEKYRPDFAINTGDTVHTQGYVDSQSAMIIHKGSGIIAEACEKVGTKLRWMIGNHDMWRDSTGSHIHSLPFLPGLIDDITDEGDILMIPYTQDYEAVKAALKASKAKVVITHLDYVGARLTASGDILSKHGVDPGVFGSRLAINGHYHHPSTLHKVVMAGSAMYHSFQDRVLPDMPRGILLLESVDEAAKYHSVYWSGRDQYGLRWVENPMTSMYHSVHATEQKALRSLVMDYAAQGHANRTHLRAVKRGVFEFDLDEFKGMFRSIKVVDQAPREAVRDVKVDFTMSPYEVVKTSVEDEDLERDEFTFTKDEVVTAGMEYVKKALDSKPRVAVDFQVRSWELENFMLISEARVEVSKGLTVVEALNKDSVAGESNGSGKSALFEGILWCLFGQTLRGLKNDDVIRHDIKTDGTIGDKIKRGCKASVTFQKGDHTYTVIRGRKHKEFKSKLIIMEDGLDISARLARDAQLQLGDVLGITVDEFVQTLFLGGGMDVRFTSLADAARKDLIENFVGVRVYSEAAAVVKEDRVFISKRLDAADNDLAIAHREVQSVKQVLEEHRVSLEVFERSQAVRKAKFTKELQELSNTREELTEQYPDEVPFDETSHEKDSTRLQGSMAVVEKTIQKLDVQKSVQVNELDRIEKLLAAGVCPTCETEVAYDALTADSSDCRRLVNELTFERESLLSERSTIYNAQAELNTVQFAMMERKRLVTRLDADMKRCENEMTAKATEIAMPDPFGARLPKLVAEYETKSRKAAASVVDADHDHMILAREFSLISYWEEAFSPTEIRSKVLDKAILYLNERLMAYSNLLTAGELRVQLSPTTATKTAGEKSKIDILVTGSGSTYEGSSSGQKRRVDLCIQFALYDLLQSFRGSSNLLVVDEMDGGLDQRGVTRLVDTLAAMGRSVFLVTHNQKLRSIISGQSVGQHLLIVREGGSSTLSREKS